MKLSSWPLISIYISIYDSTDLLIFYVKISRILHPEESNTRGTRACRQKLIYEFVLHSTLCAGRLRHLSNGQGEILFSNQRYVILITDINRGVQLTIPPPTSALASAPHVSHSRRWTAGAKSFAVASRARSNKPRPLPASCDRKQISLAITKALS